MTYCLRLPLVVADVYMTISTLMYCISVFLHIVSLFYWRKVMSNPKIKYDGYDTTL